MRLRLVRSMGDTSPDFGAGKQSPCGLETQGMTEKHLWLPKSSFHHLSAHFAQILTTFVPVLSLVKAGSEDTQLSAPYGNSHLLPRENPICLCSRNPNKHFHRRLLAEQWGIFLTPPFPGRIRGCCIRLCVDSPAAFNEENSFSNFVIRLKHIIPKLLTIGKKSITERKSQ